MSLAIFAARGALVNAAMAVPGSPFRLILHAARCVQSGKTTTAFDIFPALLAEDPVFGRKGPTEALICRIFVPVSLCCDYGNILFPSANPSLSCTVQG